MYFYLRKLKNMKLLKLNYMLMENGIHQKKSLKKLRFLMFFLNNGIKNE